jgi:hypothetical protein
MPDMLAVLALLSALIAAGLIVGVQRRLQAVRRLQIRNDAAISELQLMAEIRSQLAAGQVIAENVVAGGTSTVRAVHKGIAGIPFGILESIPVTRDTTRIVRKIHDAISDGVYGGISATNKALHQAARNAAAKSQIQRDAAGELPKDSPNKKKSVDS